MPNGKTSSREDLASRVKQLLLEKRAFIERPLTEQQIADHFGVSRTPVRDALKEIETGGLIRRVQGTGVYLERPTAQDVSDVYQLRAVIEGYAGSLAARNRNPEDVDELFELATVVTETHDARDLPAVDKAEIAFHGHILELSGNRLLVRHMGGLRTITDSIGIIYNVSFIDQEDRNPVTHQMIAEAIRDRNGERCEHLLRTHIEHAQREILEVVNDLAGV